MINSRSQACHILGLSISAKEADIKSAYKSLVKIYHPDAGRVADTGRYNEIVEAYNFLCPKDGQTPLPPINKIVGADRPKRPEPTPTAPSRSTGADYAAFERKMKKQKEQKARDFEQKQKDYSAMLKKQDDDYKRAMDAINAIWAARTKEAMVWANGIEKDGKTDEN